MKLRLSSASVEVGVLAEGDGGEVVVGTVGAERVHERAGLDVPVGPSEGTAVAIAGATGQGKGPVDDAPPPRR